MAESNVSLMPGLWRDSLHVTCGLTACTPGSVPGPTIGNEYGKTLPFLEVNNAHILLTDYCWIIHTSSPSYRVYHTHTPIPHTHPFNSPFSGTTRVSRYQKGRTNFDMTEARDSGWQSQSLIASNSEIRYNYNVYQKPPCVFIKASNFSYQQFVTAH